MATLRCPARLSLGQSTISQPTMKFASLRPEPGGPCDGWLARWRLGEFHCLCVRVIRRTMEGLRVARGNRLKKQKYINACAPRRRRPERLSTTVLFASTQVHTHPKLLATVGHVATVAVAFVLECESAHAGGRVERQGRVHFRITPHQPKRHTDASRRHPV